MRGTALVISLTLAGCAAEPCPDGQARDNSGTCVAIAAAPAARPPLPPGYTWEKPPAKDAYIADQDSIAAFNREQEASERADFERREAERAADRRTDRIVEAQEATQRELKRVADKVD